jgi:hypothetical protein
VVGDLAKDSITVSIARANEDVRRQLSTSSDAALKKLATFDSVDAAATAAAL